MIAVQTVHTTGVNWQAVAAILGVIYTPVIFAGPLVWRRVKRAWHDSITAVIGTALDARLDQIRQELADLKHADQVQEIRIARLESFQEGRDWERRTLRQGYPADRGGEQ